jgi:hypothetical protein
MRHGLRVLLCLVMPATLSAQASRPDPAVPVTSATPRGEGATRTPTAPPRARDGGVPADWPLARRQLWISGSLGRGDAGLDCQSCRGGDRRAVTADAAVGLTLTPRFTLGVQTLGWLDVIGGGVDRIVRGTQLTARVFPFRTTPVFLAGGAGMSRYTLEDDEGRFEVRSPSVEAGVGLHWRVGGVLLTPAITALTSTGGRLRSGETGNAVAPNARASLWRTSLGVTWYRALPSSSSR